MAGQGSRVQSRHLSFLDRLDIPKGHPTPKGTIHPPNPARDFLEIPKGGVGNGGIATN